MIIWITGISGAGKTTLAKAVVEKLKENSSNVINLDGDIIRDLFEDNTNYNMNLSKADKKNTKTMLIFAKTRNYCCCFSSIQ